MDNYPDSLTLVRGSRAKGELSSDVLDKIVKKDEHTNEKKIKKVKKLLKSAWSGDFSDMYFPVTFKVNKPIGLQALGFWGPFSGEQAAYAVKVTIVQLDSLQAGNVLQTLATLSTEVSAKRESLFYVDLNKVVQCPADAWIRIYFMLNGPTTCVCDSTKFNYTDDAKVTFEFSSSSKQLAEIKYVLLQFGT